MQVPDGAEPEAHRGIADILIDGSAAQSGERAVMLFE
jgi:hypothetical protein